MTKVLDSSVLLAGMLGEVGGEVLDAPGEVFHVSAVNLSEVYTKILERGGVVEDADLFLTIAVAHQAVRPVARRPRLLGARPAPGPAGPDSRA